MNRTKRHPAFNLSPERNTVQIRIQTDCALALLKSNMKQCGLLYVKKQCSECPFNKSLISGGLVHKTEISMWRCPIQSLAVTDLNKAKAYVIDWLDCIYGKELTREIIVEALL